MSEDALARKFRDLVAYGAPGCDPDRLLLALRQIDQLADVRELFPLTLS